MLNNLKIDPDSRMEFLNGLSALETVLLRPNSRDLIEICLQNKSSFFEVFLNVVLNLRSAYQNFIP